MSESSPFPQNFEDALRQAVQRSADSVGSRICSLMMLDRSTNMLVIRATQYLSAGYRQRPPIRVGYSVCGRAAKQKRAVQILDAGKDPSYSSPEIARRENLKSMLSVPMLLGGVLIGILNYYTQEERIFGEETITVVQTIANQAAEAVRSLI